VIDRAKNRLPGGQIWLPGGGKQVTRWRETGHQVARYDYQVARYDYQVARYDYQVAKNRVPGGQEPGTRWPRTGD